MKVRIKFKKYGPMKFIGHLDIMRYFQKSMRRAEIDIAYSTGFSPHQIMSFAAPLGVGLCSEGEYFDIELSSHNGSENMKNALNRVMVPGIEIVSIKELSDQNANAMACVAAAKYDISLKDGILTEKIKKQAEQFFNQSTILVTKQTKKNEISIDLKSHIYEYKVTENGFKLFVDASSSGNIKPTLVMEALYQYCDDTFDSFAYQIARIDTYTNIGNEEQPQFVPLDGGGVDF